MGLVVETLSMRNWRNFGERSIDLSPGMTVLCGHNAVGKTNTVEALQMLTAGASFRKPRPAQLVREECDHARIEARLVGDGRVVDVVCDVENQRKRFTRNGKRCVAADLSDSLMSVLFNPDDLSFVKRGASYRREELDDFGRQANRGFAKVLAAYGRSIEQRNRLLKAEHVDLALLDAWDASVALGGATLLVARVRLFERLRAHISRIYEEISEGECLDCAYESSLGEDLSGRSRDEVCDLLARRLAEGREDDLRRQQTLVGPHRDDLTFTIDGRDARAFGSQGQQRAVVLAWKMAEVELAQEIVGERPLLLLDDVMSELDERRRAAMCRFVQNGIQTVITTTNLGYFPQELLADAKVVEIDG